MRPLAFDPSSPETTPTPPPTEDPPGGAASSAFPSFDLVKDEFRRTIITRPIVRIKFKIHSFSHPPISGEEPEGPEPATHILREVLEPERTAVEAALHRVRPRRLSHLFSDYFDGSENTSRLCLLLHRSILSARSLYAPLVDLLEALPSAAPTAASSPTAVSPTRSRSFRRSARCFLSPSQCDHALQIFLHFSSQENPLTDSAASLETIRRRLEGLAGQLNSWLRRDRHRRRAAAGAAICLGVAAVAATVGAVVATAHAGPAAGAALAAPLVCCSGDPLRRRRRRERRTQIEKAVKGIFGLSKSLETFEMLARQLHDAVEDHRALIRRGLQFGKEDRSFMAELVRELRQTRQPLLKKLEDLENHVFVFLYFINSARKLLFDLFGTPSSSSSDRLPVQG